MTSLQPQRPQARNGSMDLGNLKGRKEYFDKVSLNVMTIEYEILGVDGGSNALFFSNCKLSK